jgi:RNA polymerase sigma-70 factor, ECF subfamily
MSDLNDLGPPGHQSVVIPAPRLVLAAAPASAASPEAVVDADRELVQRARAGDRAAFAVLFRRHHGRVRAMCARFLGVSASLASAEIDDAVQVTFLEAWRSLHRFEGRSRFTTWITRIAIHTCLSTRRRLARMLSVAEASPSARPQWAEDARSSDDVATDHRQEAALARVLARLSEKKRVVFVLADLESLTSTEIADVLGIPDATVRTRLFHARREVASALRAEPAFAELFTARIARGPSPSSASGASGVVRDEEER